MSNFIAPEGQVYVCRMCGKQSKDKYGEQPIDIGWDVSCMMHAVLVYKSTIVMNNGRVTYAEPVPDTIQTDEFVNQELERLLDAPKDAKEILRTVYKDQNA